MPKANLKISAVKLEALNSTISPYDALRTGKTMIKAWVEEMEDENRISYGRSFIYSLINAFWKIFYETGGANFQLPGFSEPISFKHLDKTVIALAESLASSSSKLGIIESSHYISSIYTTILPDKLKTQYGIFFTPPVLTNRLLNLIEAEGIEWGKSRVLDPACGGGAFLAPVALRMASSIKNSSPEAILSIIESNLSGIEIDFFSGWLSQVFVEITLSKLCLQAKRRLNSIIQVGDTLNYYTSLKYDIIIGNPPYGKLKLSIVEREKYKDSLYGHANLYGLFTHIALNMVRKGGVIGYVTPTSFLAGEYFKNLRQLLIKKSRPKAIDFILARKGVFDEVLQETLLAIYVAEPRKSKGVKINHIHPQVNGTLEIDEIGEINLPNDPSAPWILPRNTEQQKIAKVLQSMTSTMKDWGYEVKTGPLVWNRHKNQLSNKYSKSCYPLIWAESIIPDGSFEWRADKRNHQPYFKAKDTDIWLITRYPCILLQRTTAKEQNRRLIATILSEAVLNDYQGVVIENHINIVKPISETPKVSFRLMAAFLNSQVADSTFRCISGSVAVSAYELESMPLPNIEEILPTQYLIDSNASQSSIDEALLKIYIKK
jgi:adenine-specific DNA-methyltransferase